MASIAKNPVTFPENRVAIIANGVEEVSQESITAIKTSQIVIAVDGGLNFCHQHEIHPQHLIGDLDSFNPDLLSKNRCLEIIRLERAKDILDLEAAIQLAFRVSRMAVYIFNALGGRKDHHISNLYLLLKYPGTTIVSNHTFICSIHADSEPIIGDLFQRSIFAFYENAGLEIDSQEHLLKKGDRLSLPEEATIKVLNGEVLLISKRASGDLIPDTNINPLEALSFPHFDNQEDIYLLDSKNPTIELETIPGLTISLIPWLGKVEGIETEGLKWNLMNEQMHKEFVGISNIALAERIRVSIKKGFLLCFVEKTFIDLEMIGLKDHSSTKRLTSAKS